MQGRQLLAAVVCLCSFFIIIAVVVVALLNVMPLLNDAQGGRLLDAVVANIIVFVDVVVFYSCRLWFCSMYKTYRNSVFVICSPNKHDILSSAEHSTSPGSHIRTAAAAAAAFFPNVRQISTLLDRLRSINRSSTCRYDTLYRMTCVVQIQPLKTCPRR